MGFFHIMAVVLTVTALLGFINERYVHLPTSIGVTLGGLVVSLVLLSLGRFGVDLHFITGVVDNIDFDQLLMGGMLSFLLFAGSLHVNINELLERRWTITILATVGVVLSTLIVAVGLWAVLALLGIHPPFVYALVFGALISPTDPVAVLSILRNLRAPRALESMITGESLFNDGVGVVVFTVVVGMLGAEHAVTALHTVLLFLEEAVGGLVLGAGLGLATYALLQRIDDYPVEILITLAAVTGGYALAGFIHVSGPLAMVVAGLFVGNQGRRFAMSDRTREHLDTFWVVIDELLNAVLFVLIGLELLVLDIDPRYVLAGSLAIVIALLARFISVAVPLAIIRLRTTLLPYTIPVMTWGGLRGGIAIALALSIPPAPERDLILVVTYCVVVFSILVQGLTVAPLLRRMPAD